MGPVDTYMTTKSIDEIVLNLSPKEEIYMIKGICESIKTNGIKSDQIVKLAIYTTFGQYVEFGRSNLDCNFIWEYHFNLRCFDGFLIGWDEKNINYLASLTVEGNPNAELMGKTESLADTTYESRLYIIEPIFLTPRYGKIDCYTVIEDDLYKLNIFQLVKKGEIFLSEIVIYYDKHINSIDVEYTNRKTGEKYKSAHCGTLSKKYFIKNV